MKLKQGCSIYSDYGLNISAEEYADDGIPIIRTSDVDNFGVLDLLNTKYVDSRVVGTKMLRKGDVLFSRAGTIGRAMVFDADVDVTYAAYLVRFRPHPKRLLSKYIGYWAQSAEYWKQISADTIQSTIGNFNANKFANLSIHEHDLSTQRAIANFLDRETARIDSLINKKKRLVELLGEKRNALITTAVTGSNPNTPEISGDRDRRSVEGGEEKIPIKHAAQFFNGAAFKPSDWGDHGLPIIRIAQLTGKPFDNFFDGIIPRILKISDNDLLFSWSATIDAFIWDKGDAILNQHIFKVIPKKNAEKKYLYYLIKHYAPVWSDDDAHGSTMRHIKKESLSNKVFLPDLSTQRAIVDFLDRETARVDKIIERTRVSIDRLKEYRSALITAAVTGQINVSTYASSRTTDRQLDAIQSEIQA